MHKYVHTYVVTDQEIDQYISRAERVVPKYRG